MTQETFTSGRVINFGYDSGSRLSNLNGGQGHVYADAFTYASHGAISSFTLGNGATISLGYDTNGRLQLSDLTLSKYSTVLQKYEYKYGQIVSGTLETSMNNGQLAQVESWIGTEKQYRQQYFYDTLGRLKESIEKYGTSLGNTAYDVKYLYDEFGNRQQRAADNTGNSAITQYWVESGDISTSTNRFTSGVTYDAAGNITSDQRFRDKLYSYDANGRQKYAANANGSSPITAVFDGAGQRVANKASGVMTIMVYDAGGKLAAEYGATAPSTASLQYVTADYQGSTRVVTDSAGAVSNRRDYLPFGEEIGATVGARAGKGFGAGDGVRQKYAGMESDDATNMAHTLWRKQDNLSGRWTSPDPYGGSMTIADPQTFNRYTYCNNDPVNQVDSLGLYPNNYHDATSRWEDVQGYFWGDGSFDTNSRRNLGGATIGNAEYRHSSRINTSRRAKKAAADGKYECEKGNKKFVPNIQKVEVIPVEKLKIYPGEVAEGGVFKIVVEFESNVRLGDKFDIQGQRINDTAVEELRSQLLQTGLYTDVKINLRTTERPNEVDVIISPIWLPGAKYFVFDEVDLEGFDGMDEAKVIALLRQKGTTIGSPLLRLSLNGTRSSLSDAIEEVYLNNYELNGTFQRRLMYASFEIVPLTTDHYKLIVRAEYQG